MTDTKEMSLEDKAKEYAIKVHGSHPNDQTVRDNLAFDYVTIYRQALKDMMERAKERSATEYHNGLEFIYFIELEKIAEDLGGK